MVCDKLCTQHLECWPSSDIFSILLHVILYHKSNSMSECDSNDHPGSVVVVVVGVVGVNFSTF